MGFEEQAQLRVHPISRTRPGNLVTTFFAPFTATALQAPAEVPGVGNDGVLYPPNPLLLDLQHLNAEGPGHWFETPEPEQSDCQRQFPPDVPLLQDGLVQQRTLDGSEGHAPVIVVPPLEVQSEVLMQTPRGSLLDGMGERGFSCGWYLEHRFYRRMVR